MKIEAVFSDYDGTLSLIQAPREEAFIPAELMRLLNDLSRLTPVAIITTKDLPFIKDRVPFAHATAAICGLEIQIGGKRIVDERILESAESIREAYDEASNSIGIEEGILLERKTTMDGVLAAFSIDWRPAEDWTEAHRRVGPLLARCRLRGLHVFESERSPFVDLYAAEVSKGRAFVSLKRELKVDGPVMYLGDSEMDNPVFEMADVSIAVTHRESPPRLRSRYSIRFEDLPRFVSELLAANLNFNPRMVADNSMDRRGR